VSAPVWADRSAALGGCLTCGEGIAVGGEVGPGRAIAAGRSPVPATARGAAVHQPWFDQAEPVGSPEEMDPSIT
jgi:hypothetical protein